MSFSIFTPPKSFSLFILHPEELNKNHVLGTGRTVYTSFFSLVVKHYVSPSFPHYGILPSLPHRTYSLALS